MEWFGAIILTVAVLGLPALILTLLARKGKYYDNKTNEGPER